MEMPARNRGTQGEELACHYLQRAGYTILERNFRFCRGEIDIVATDGEYLVFCEVKLRDSDEYGPPEYSITSDKQRTIRRVAKGYLFAKKIREHACRFDVITIRVDGTRAVLNHLRNAFS